jgi:NADPH2:quinone reductase
VLAALYRRPGASDVLSVEEVDAPKPGPGEVAVRLRVAGVNPTDWKTRGRKQPSTFQVPGQDGAGDIVAVGEGVDPAGSGSGSGSGSPRRTGSGAPPHRSRSCRPARR